MVLICKALAAQRPFYNSYDAIVGNLLNILNDASPIIRARAIKALSLVVEVNCDVLTEVIKRDICFFSDYYFFFFCYCYFFFLFLISFFFFASTLYIGCH